MGTTESLALPRTAPNRRALRGSATLNPEIEPIVSPLLEQVLVPFWQQVLLECWCWLIQVANIKVIAGQYYDKQRTASMGS